MSVYKDYTSVITTVLILLVAIFVLAWMDIYWSQIIILVQVMINKAILLTLIYQYKYNSSV